MKTDNCVAGKHFGLAITALRIAREASKSNDAEKRVPGWNYLFHIGAFFGEVKMAQHMPHQVVEHGG